MAERTLEAILTATETVSEALDDISEGLGDVAQTGEVTRDALDKVSEGTAKLTSLSLAGADAIEKEAGELKSLAGAAEAADKAKNAVTVANEELMMAAKRAETEISEETRSIAMLAAGADNTQEFIANLARWNIITAESAEQLEESLDDVSMAEVKASGTSALLAKVLRRVEDAADETEEEVTSLSGAFSVLGGQALATSLNLGPFNFALQNLFYTLPQLIAVTGALTTALGALSAAALTAGTAMGLIFGGGVLMMAEQIANTSGDIESQMEAIQEVMSRVGRVFARALRPLQNALSVQMFQDAVLGAARALHMVSLAIEDMQPLLATFQDQIGEAFFSNWNSVMRETGALLQAMMPYLVQFTNWFMSNFADALAFLRKESQRFLPTLEAFGKRMTEFFTAFTRLGITALKGILPVISGVLHIIGSIADVLNTLPDAITSTAFAFLTLFYIGKKVYDFGKKFNKFLDELQEAWEDLPGRAEDFFGKMKSGLEENLRKFEPLDEALDNLQDELVEAGFKADFMGRELKEALSRGGEDKKAKIRLQKVNETIGEKIGEQDEDGNWWVEMEQDPAAEIQESSDHAALSIASLTASIYGLGNALRTLYGIAQSTLAPIVGYFSGIAASLVQSSSLLSGIVATLGSLSTGGALAVVLAAGVALTVMFKEMDSVIKAVTSTLAFFGNVIRRLVFPVWNAFVDLLEISFAPFFAITDGIMMVLRAFGLLEGAIATFHAIGDAIMLVMDIWQGFWNILGVGFDLISDLLYSSIIAGFEALIWVLKSVIHWVTLFGEEFANTIGWSGSWIDWLGDKWDYVVGGMTGTWDTFVTYIEDQINAFLDQMNSIINWVNNNVPGVNIQKFEGEFGFSDEGTEASESLKGLKSESKSAKDKVTEGKTTNNYYQTNNEYNFGDFNMLPEEKARVKGLVKQALNQSNRNKRLEGGHIG